MEHVVIVGAGHGGAQAAASLRDEGFQGRVTLIGEERHAPYHRPPLSKAFLKDPAAQPQFLRGPRFYAEHDIDLMLGARAASLDSSVRRVRLEGGGALDYSHLVLATGGRPRALSAPGADLAGVHSLISLDDAERLRESLRAAGEAVVIGGGFIGMEIAATLAALGAKVTVVEAAARVLGRAVAPPISDHMRRRHQSWGVEILLGESVARIEGDNGRAVGVTTSTGRRLPASLVVAGIGAEPNVALAQAAGLACANGVEVDEFLRASAPDIFAIGDCASYPHWSADRRVRLESVQNATDQGRAVARSIVGRGEPYRAAPWFWSDQQHIKLQMVGLSFDADDHLLVGDPEADRFSVYHFRGPKLLAIDSVNSAGEHMMGRRMLAAGFNPAKETVRAGLAALKSAFAP